MQKNNYSTDKNTPPLWVVENSSNTNLLPLWQNLIPLFEYLKQDEVTEIVINKAKEIFVEKAGDWQSFELKEFTNDFLYGLASQIANYNKQKFDEKNPILSATLPTGERIQICGFSTVEAGHISYTIRKPSIVRLTIQDYLQQDYFSSCSWVSDVDLQKVHISKKVPEPQKELCSLLSNKDWLNFFTKAIEYKQNIILSGSTGSGKTTFLKALVALVPQDERLISIENVDEIRLNHTHKNSVSLFYSAGNQGISEIGQKELLVSSLRMKPDRVFLAELLEGNEAFYYLRNIGSGHPGSITTMHANTAFGAKEQLVLFLKESEAGNSLSKTEIQEFLDTKIDIILQVSIVNNKRKMTQIDFNPLRLYHE